MTSEAPRPASSEPVASTDSASNSPPPSPLPALPEEITPGARATALQTAFSKALEATLNKCSYDNFATCFPTTAQYRPSTLEGFHRDFTVRLGEVCLNNFNEVMKDRNVIALLNSLDRLIHEARLRKQAASTSTSPDNTSTSEPTPPIPPHTLPPSSLVSAHLASFLSDTSSSIAAETAELEKRNVELMETVRRQRGEIEGLVGGLERVVGDLERSAGMVQGDDVVGLTAEVKMVEEELKG